MTQDAILDYEMITVLLSGTRAATEFNLQFLRLNLGTLINAGEKLHAMVGVMRDRLFDDDGLGQHPFLEAVGIPTRRYARQLLAAQLMLQASERAARRPIARGRHFDLQRYLKTLRRSRRPTTQRDQRDHGRATAAFAPLSATLGNRAIAVSVVLAAVGARTSGQTRTSREQFGQFVEVFIERACATRSIA